ncbi:MAG: hypothetical protein GY854_04060 [Deltaproteobacteria bacterium]|nr:hypothetical protein [Deltaproteobacteria bacterium]
MKRLEIIHLRLTAGSLDDLVEDIRRSATAGSQTAEITIFQHVGVATDLGIHILHETDDSVDLHSSLGMSLASALKEHGMVEHSVWIERNDEVV